MAGPDNDMVIAALVGLGMLAVLLAVLLVRRSREVREVRELGARFAAVAQTGDLGERLAPHVGEGSAGDIAENADLLLARLQKEASTRAEREFVYRRLAEAMHEAVASRLEMLYRGMLILTFGGGTNELQRDLITMFSLGFPRAAR
jgi:hypothetical protein